MVIKVGFALHLVLIVQIYILLCTNSIFHYRGCEFRLSYGRLGRVRSLLMPGVPVIALAATATQRTTSRIIETLEMKRCSIIKGSNNRRNICYHVEKLPKYQEYDFEKQEQVFDNCFKNIVSDIQRNGLNSQKYVIFCYSKSICLDIFEYFERNLKERFLVSTDKGQKRIVEMYVKETDDITKKSVVERFTAKNGSLKIVVATVVFGMGVDCPNIREVYHFKSPSSLMDYLQESGRAGRDGLPSKAFLFYSSKEFGNCLSKLKKKGKNSVMHIKDLEDMKRYCDNICICRRFFLLEHFDGAENAKKEISLHQITPHMCCDICSLKCTCDDCIEQKMLTENKPPTCPGTVPRTVPASVPLSTFQKQLIRQKLNDYRSSLMDDSVLRVDYSTGFTVELITNIVELCDELFSVDDVLTKLDVWNPEQAEKVLQTLSQAKDIEPFK